MGTYRGNFRDLRLLIEWAQHDTVKGQTLHHAALGYETAAARLAQRGLVQRDGFGGFGMTPKGFEVAEKILEQFLSER